MTSGILPIDKPLGDTSFSVVRAVRRSTGEKRVGHAGTLDPAATGLLLVCLGQATRITEYLMDLPKTYRAGVRLGIATDTFDSEGVATSTGDPSGVREDAVRAVVREFAREIQQVPPDFSAVKVGGQAAYRRARRGETLTLAPRAVRIYRIDLLRFELPLLELEVECGRGTYIRSLANDIGLRLGCGAHLAGLVRTQIGPFDLDSAVALPEFIRAAQEGAWYDFLRPMDYALLHLPALTLGIEDEKDIRHGQPVRLDEASFPAGQPPRAGPWRAYAEDGSLLAIVEFDARAGVWRPLKVFSGG